MNIITKIGISNFLLLFVFNSVMLWGQTVITHPIGDRITPEEAIEYSLFSDIVGFEIAELQLSALGGDKYTLTYYFRSGDKLETSSFRFGDKIKKLMNRSLFQQDSVNSNIDISTNLNIKLSLKSGSTIITRFERWSGNTIVFETEFGLQNIDIDKIENILILDERHFKDGIYYATDPNYTRLFFAPTARALKKGAGYFADYELVFPGFAYGVTDKFSIGGGIFPFSTGDNSIAWLTPKYTIMETRDRAVAIGLLNIIIGGNDNVGILYGTSTFGESDNALTVGLGYGYVGSNLAEKPMIMIGGEKRIGKRTKFLTENWLFPGADEPLFSVGIRWFGDKLAADFGFIRTFKMALLGFRCLDIVITFYVQQKTLVKLTTGLFNG